MKKIVEELIANTPELEKNRYKLGKTVKFLSDNNPNIEISKDFKISLKNRIKSLIELKQGKKTKFSIFVFPVFSAMFVVLGFFYFYSEIDFFNKPEVDNFIQINSISDEDLQIEEINEIGDMFEVELMKTIEEEDEKSPEGKNINQLESIESTEPFEKMSRGFIDQKKVESDNDDAILQTQDSQIYDLSIEENEDIGIESTDDNQVIELFEALGEEYGEDFNLEKTPKGIDSISNDSMIDGFGAKMMMDEDSINDFDTISIDEINLSFEDYCESESGELSGTGTLQKCRINKKECLASEFINGICDFTELR